MNDDPIAFFITWTVYGTFLQGDIRGWRKRREGFQSPEPRLEEWRKAILKHDVILLNEAQRLSVDGEIARLCTRRGWKLWTCNTRSNHAHVLVTASGFDGPKVRDQLKANCTRVLREGWSQFRDRPVWTEGGDCECINQEDVLEQVILYVRDAQDRKSRDEM